MRLRPLSFREVKRKLEVAGFHTVSQKGSHLKFIKEENDSRLVVIVPNHPFIKKGTLSAIIDQAGMTLSEFEKL